MFILKGFIKTSFAHRLRYTKNLRKIVNISLPIILAHFLGAQKNRLIETVLLSTHNICFAKEIRN